MGGKRNVPRILRPLANVFKLFAGDVRRLGGNVVTVISVLGLVALPSLFSWYNILACWDVFDNTGNLTVAVANSDEGYTSDLIPIELNVGDRVESALRENDQLNWVFTDEEDAVDGARSGRYYAAVVIPRSFSADMMSFYSDDVKHAQITYYNNLKKSAIAPKVTDQGADQIAAQVNQVFAKTVSEIVLSVGQALADSADKAGIEGSIQNMSDHLRRLARSLEESAQVVDLYSGALGSTQDLIDDAGELLVQTKGLASQAAEPAAQAEREAKGVTDALDGALSSLSTAIDQCRSSFSSVPDYVATAFDSSAQLAGGSSSELRAQAALVDGQAVELESLRESLEAAMGLLPEDLQARGDSLVKRLDSTIALFEQVRDELDVGAEAIDDAVEQTGQGREEATQIAESAATSLQTARDEYSQNLEPALGGLAESLSDAAGSVAGAQDAIDGAGVKLTGSAAALAGRIGEAQEKLDSVSGDLNGAAKDLVKLADAISGALADGDSELLRQVIGSDPTTLANAVAAPVKLERHAVYPVANFGSAMSPLYTTLALWIGALLMMVTFKLNPSERQVKELDKPSARQLFLGRFGVVSVVSLMQSTSVALGNLLFLGVQAAHPLLYLVCFWTAGLVFAFIIYTLVSLFANFGKALGVVLLIVQVSGGGGSFPLKLLPQFFQDVSPYLPIAHAVNAMRAAMFGMYQGDFWVEIATLAAFAVPFLVLGLLLQAPLSKVVPKFVAKVESSKLM